MYRSPRERVSWTSAGSDDAFLALDRSFDGRIDNGRELFGDYTTQPDPFERNGFLALAMFDQPTWGGNMDGAIDSRDAVYPHLRLWFDDNHDGRSDPCEMMELASAGVEIIELEYHEASRRDRYGNRFRFFSRVVLASGVVRKAVDVFFVGR